MYSPGKQYKRDHQQTHVIRHNLLGSCRNASECTKDTAEQ